jgi:hypothetical protein
MIKSDNGKFKYKFRSSLFINKCELNENNYNAPDIFDTLPTKDQIFFDIEVENNTKILQKMNISDEK